MMNYSFPEFKLSVNIEDEGALVPREKFAASPLKDNIVFLYLTKTHMYSCTTANIPDNFHLSGYVVKNLEELKKNKAFTNLKVANKTVTLNWGILGEMAWIVSNEHRELQVYFIFDSKLFCLSAIVGKDAQIDENNYTLCPLQQKLFGIIDSFREILPN